jgi:hypothetical protein
MVSIGISGTKDYDVPAPTFTASIKGEGKITVLVSATSWRKLAETRAVEPSNKLGEGETL